MPLYADIIVNISASALDRSFQYRIPDALKDSIFVGSRVEIPFGRRQIQGYVVAVTQEALLPEEKIKDIIGPAPRGIALEDRIIALAAWMRQRYGCTMNQALLTVLPAKKAVKKRSAAGSMLLPEEDKREASLTLTAQQQAVSDAFYSEMKGRNRPCLLFGVTGSGKTEVYMDLIERMRKEGRQVILLIPEIALTYQTIRRFTGRFGEGIGILHSRQSAGEKYETVEKAKRGELQLVIGPRSALFTPMPDLGLIIIDEEHEESYRSEMSPRYHSTEVAGKLAQLAGASLLLGSATPSLESYCRAEKGEYFLQKLTQRAAPKSRLPRVEVADLRQELAAGNKSIFSRSLKEKIQERLADRQQIMLFLNRRGYAGFVSCRSCGRPMTCPHCDISLTMHRGGRLICHYCGYERPFPEHCPSCGSPYIAAFGAGTQKVENLVKKEFPEARVLRMDADTTRGKDGHSRILSVFAHQGADILIGTQMIVKGHDFPNVSLVGILAADMSLLSTDFKAAERSFSLITQAAGRAGRSDLPGEVIIQTYQPEHYAVVTAAAQDYEAFYKEEIARRRLLRYPPAESMLVMTIIGKDEKENEKKALALKEEIIREFAAHGPEIVGPAAPYRAKLQDQYLQMLHIKHGAPEVLLAIRDFSEQKLGAGAQFDLY